MTTNYLGRCGSKGCKTTVRLTATAKKHNGTNRYGTPQTLPAFVLAGRIAKRDASGAIIDPNTAGWDIEDRTYDLRSAYDFDVLPMCVEHRRVLRFERVDGRHDEAVRCDAR